MFAKVVAKLFGRAPRTPIRNAHRFRPQVEGLETRWVPAQFYWHPDPVIGDYSAQTPGNWFGSRVPGVLPGPLDDVHFEASDYGTNDHCLNFGGTAYNSVTLDYSYTETVTLSAGFTAGGFTLRNGVINQPTSMYGTDITVTGNFTWTGGTLNGSGDDATLTVVGGTADISPANQGTVTTGDTLVFAAATTVGGIVGSFATFNPGIVNFIGGHGVDVNEFCTADLPQSKVVWDPVQKGIEPYRLSLKGTCKVRNGSGQPQSMSKLGMPVVVDGGIMWVREAAGVTFAGNYTVDILGVSVELGSVYMTSGEIRIVATGTLGAEKGMLMVGGTLEEFIPSDVPGGQANRTATIDGKLFVSGGTVTFFYQNENQSGLEAHLSVTKDVVWTSGIYKPFIDLDANEHRSEWRTDQKFTFDIDDTEVQPVYYFAQNGQRAGQVWSVFYAEMGFTGLPQLDVNGYSIELNPTDAHFVRIKKN